jgi:cyanophycinase
VRGGHRSRGRELIAGALLILAALTRFYTGNPDDVKPRLHGPLLLLAGGGGDVTAGLQAAIDQIRGNGKIDVVVLRASGAEGYNPYFMNMNGVDSVLTMVITDRESASRPDVVQAVREAELIYFAGGDQCNYIRWIKGTPVEKAVERVYRRGGAVGGTSAGLAIMGQYAYDACPNQSAKSAEVLLDPFHEDVSVSTGFFEWPALRGVVTDTHFQQRDRLGRTLVFMARSGARIGLGVSEGTIALVDRDGRGVVQGKGSVHIVVASEKPAVMKPLTFRGLRIVRYESGARFDLRKIEGGKTIEVVEGRLTEDAYEPPSR